MKYVAMASLCLFGGACKQSAVLGDGNGGGAGAGLAEGGNGAGGGAPLGGNGEGGGPGADPMALGAAVCEARAECESVEQSCAHDTGCMFVLFREELHTPLTTCLANCGSFEACWQAAVAGSTPPDEFALYASLCNQSVVECEGDPEGMGNDWCEYDFFSAANYSAMVDCFDISCGDINDCLRTVVFAAEPSCFDL